MEAIIYTRYYLYFLQQNRNHRTINIPSNNNSQNLQSYIVDMCIDNKSLLICLS